MNRPEAPVLPSRSQGLTEPPNVLDTIKRFERALRVHILSSEGEILLALYASSPLGVTELQAVCSASPSKFFATLTSLQRRGLIAKLPDAADRRRRCYSLAEEVRRFAHDALTECLSVAAREDLADDVRLLVALDDANQRIGNHFGLALTSYRYRIVSSLFRLGHWHPSDGTRLADTSPVSFFAALDHLKSIGVIECFEDPNDRRKKRCRLTEHTQKSFSNTVREIFAHLVDYGETHPMIVAPLALLLA